MLWVYDIETYSNFFCVTFKNYKTKEIKQFVIFKDRNDAEKLIDFISDHTLWLAGYNNSHFDNQILKYMAETRNFSAHSIYNFAKQIVEDDITDYMYSLPFKSLDLMKIGNLSQKSLKLTGTLFKWHKLQDLPYSWDHIVMNQAEADKILKYNVNDVEITEQLLKLLEPQVNLRFNISKEYGINAYSQTDSGIANKLLEKFYEEVSGISPYVFKRWRTKRPRIVFWDVIFHDINFYTKELHDFLEELRKKVFYPSVPFMKTSVIFNGKKYIIGVGGLHSEDTGALYKEDEDNLIIDADIGSMYPTMIVNNNIHPEHLGDAFIKKYKEVMNDRLEAKRKSKDPTLTEEERNINRIKADTLKITINSSFGKMGYENHWLYDPLAMLRVTINGQLYLLMLIEYLTKKGFEVVSANTDGIVTIVPRVREDEYKDICRKWEDATKFELEYTYYKTYARTTVNDYIAITKDGYVKTKGDFNIPDISKLHEDTFMLRRGFDKPIIAIALNEFFKNDTPIRDTILNHKDIFDFCTCKKTDKKFINEFHHVKDGNPYVEELQQSVRYYISTDGGSLYKKESESGKMINYCVGKRVTIFNDYFYSDDYKIDYNYYIAETQKLLDEIIKPQLTLF